MSILKDGAGVHTGRRDRSITYVRLDEIQGADVNPKAHDGPGIARSVGDFGLAELPLLDERTGRLVAGHGRIEDLRSRKATGGVAPPDLRIDDDGEWLVPVQAGWSSKNDAHARAYVAASNKLSENGGWDKDLLGAYLGDLNAHGLLELAGFTVEEMDDLLDDGDAGGQPDPPPEASGDIEQRVHDVIAQALLDEFGDTGVAWAAASDAAAVCVKRLKAEALLAEDR